METLRKLRKGKACSGFGIHFNVVACFEKLAKVENCCCMVRLEAIHADLNALDIENVEKELDKLAKRNIREHKTNWLKSIAATGQWQDVRNLPNTELQDLRANKKAKTRTLSEFSKTEQNR